MTQIIESLEAHYEIHEVPFGRDYEWHPAYTILECDCGEQSTLTDRNTITTCWWCDAALGAFIQDTQEREGRLRDKVTRPWRHDTQEQAEQHLRDEVAYPKDPPWRYSNITSSDTHVV
ncbi:MAG: hypothetical protein M3315_02290 [Actinomycetota bacterium]|nr:hypothetical protein [Actinomycetota bacterium]